MKFIFVPVFLLAQILFAQNKIDSLFRSPDHFDSLQKLDKLKFENKQQEGTLSLQYLLLQSKINKLDEKFFLGNKILQAEIQENYIFGKDELESGLSQDELIAYLKNKKETMKILADTYDQHSDVNWDKIQKILGISQTAAAIILGTLSLMKYH